MFGIGTTELIIVGIIAVILFGSRLPSVARSLGKSLHEFKRGMRDVEDDVRDAVYSEPAGHIQHHDDHAKPAESHHETADTPGR